MQVKVVAFNVVEPADERPAVRRPDSNRFVNHGEASTDVPSC